MSFFLLKEEDSHKEIRLIKEDQRSSMMSEDNRVSQDKFKAFFLMGPPPHFQWCHILFLADQCFSPSVNVLCNVNYKGII